MKVKQYKIKKEFVWIPYSLKFMICFRIYFKEYLFKFMEGHSKRRFFNFKAFDQRKKLFCSGNLLLIEFCYFHIFLYVMKVYYKGFNPNKIFWNYLSSWLDFLSRCPLFEQKWLSFVFYCPKVHEFSVPL